MINICTLTRQENVPEIVTTVWQTQTQTHESRVKTICVICHDCLWKCQTGFLVHYFNLKSSITNFPSSFCVFRKKRGYQHSATSWRRDRLYATAADRLQARIRTTTPRHPHLSQIPSLCFPRLATPTPPQTITPSHLPSPTPPTCTRRTARWAATIVTTARSRCCINRRGTGGGGRQSHSAHRRHKTPRDTLTFTCFGDEHSSVVTLFWNAVWKHEYVHESALYLAASESHAGNTRPHSFDLTVFNPATRHLWLVEAATSTSQTSSTGGLFKGRVHG